MTVRSRHAAGRSLLLMMGVLALLGACDNGDDGDESGSAPDVGDHWHAQFTVVDCGAYQPAAPAFEISVDGDRVGVHTHGDGFIHFHPFTRAESGAGATVGRFLDYQGYRVDEASFELWGPIGERRNGESCPDGQPGTVRWAVNGEEQDGRLSAYRPQDGDRIVVAFVPDGEEVPPPPNATRAQD